MLQNIDKRGGQRMKSGLVAVIAVVCLVGSAGATYLFVNEINQSEINSLTSEHESEISSLNDIDDDRQEFDRLILKAREALDEAWLNRGYAEAYQDVMLRIILPMLEKLMEQGDYCLFKQRIMLQMIIPWSLPRSILNI